MVSRVETEFILDALDQLLQSFYWCVSVTILFWAQKNHPDFLMILRVAYSDSLIEIEPELR